MPVSAPARVYLALPNYGEFHALLLHPLLQPVRHDSGTAVNLYPVGSSALTFNFNLKWTEALNRRETDGITHFAMLHADVSPAVGWIDTLLDELRQHNASVVSAVIPLKDLRGVTSTAIGKEVDSIHVEKRLTVRQARRLPKTFTAADCGYPNLPLLINTGCWIADIRQPWADNFPGFDIINGIVFDKGEYSARFYPEDWFFGNWLFKNGVKTMATTAVPLSHVGMAQYRNDLDWGEEEDPTDKEPPPMEIGRKPEPLSTSPGWKKEPTREIVAVRYAEDLGWVHGWLDDIVVKHGPNLTYRIYDKGPQGDTPNIGNLDWTYLHHIVNRWDSLADWTVFTQADPFPHMNTTFDALLQPASGAAFPHKVKCREWGDAGGRLAWVKFPDYWKRQYENGTIHPAKLSLRDWFKEFIGVDIEKLGALEYHPGAIFGVSRDTIQRRPREFYGRLLANLGEGGHRAPEEAHYCERAWPYIFAG
jgi:hypothetical protein